MSTQVEHDDSHASHVEDDPEIWGWHHTFHKGAQIGGWIVAISLLCLTLGNHQGRVEDLWLIVIALGMIAVLLYDVARNRKSWRS